MGVLEEFASWIVYGVLKMQQGNVFAGAAEYFIADTIKVFILLAVMVFLVSVLRTFITPQKVKKFLGGKREGVGNVLAALLGVPTPFCSCSAVPMFIGMVEAGVPLGVTFSFLISSPMVNEVAIALLLGLVGWQITALYIGSGLAIAIVAGILIGRMGLEKEVEEFVYKIKVGKEAGSGESRMKWRERLGFAKAQTEEIVWKVAPFLVIGIAIGSLIHGMAPIGWLSEVAGKNDPLAVPVVVLVGVPLYSNAAGMIPIVQALMGKGMALGTALAFMMSVTALSLPEMIILRRVLKPKLLAVFALILAVSITFVGLLFNLLVG